MPNYTPEQLFQQYYEAALLKQKEIIEQLIADGHVIDIEKDGQTVAQSLAIAGAQAAVELLRAYHAKWDRIALGYIEGKHYQLAEELIESQRLLFSVPDDYFDDENPATKIANQLANKGSLDLLRLLTRYPEIIPDYCAYKAMENGHHALAEILRLPPYNSNINQIADRAAARGLFDYCDKLLAEGALPEFVAKGAARFGAFDQVEKLRLYAVEHNMSFCRNATIAGNAAFGGHFAYVEQILRDAPQEEKNSIIEHVYMMSQKKQPAFCAFFKSAHPLAKIIICEDEANEVKDSGFDCA
jgi:hypothetical protein